MKFTRFCFSIILLVFSITNIGCEETQPDTNSDGTAGQPCAKSSEWNWVAPIEASGWCGPASLYQIIQYYGDQEASYYYRELSFGFLVWGDGQIYIEDITPENPIDVGETEFALFIQPDGFGSGWDRLKKVARLYYTKNLNDGIYDVFVCSSFTETEEVDVRRQRLQEIHNEALKHDVPVLIHLNSGIPGFGHYVTLIGYDPDQGKVYYVDSLKHDQGILTVSVDDFLQSNFYDGGLFYKARWDGEWMAFWHRDEDINCHSCYEP